MAGDDVYRLVRVEPSGPIYEHSCGSQVLDSHIAEHNAWHNEGRGGSSATPPETAPTDGLPTTMLRTVPIDDEPDEPQRHLWPETTP